MKSDLTIKNYRRFEDTHPLRFNLDDGITALVGLNNSGKSSVLRFFYELRTVWGYLSNPNGNFIAALRGNGQPLNFLGVQDPTEPFSNMNQRDMEVAFEFVPIEDQSPLKLVRCVITASRQNNTFTLDLWTGSGKVQDAANFNAENLVTNNGAPLAELVGIFRFFSSLRDALYIGPFRNAINVGATQYFDVNVGTAFIDTWHDWQTGPTKRHNDAIKTVVRDIQRIFGYHELEIIAARQLNTLQVYANGKSYKLQELGGGIAQFIVVLGNAAIRTPGLILIDEPELNLHPALQLDFLTSLASYARTGVLFATHSLGLARSGADRVYSVHMGDQRSEVSPYEDTPRLPEFLGEMSFAGFRELGVNKILLVEGPTDIKTAQQFLRLFRKDHQTVPLSLGGSGMINGNREVELSEVLRIAPDVSVLIDSERDHAGAPLPTAREAFVDVCRRLGMRVHVLERRAIENYFSESAIRGQLGDNYRSLAPFESLGTSPMGWSKHQNWRIARRMTLGDVQDTDLGRFLVGL